MRIVKLSEDDPETKTLCDVERYFEETMPNRNPPGRFFVPRGRIRRDNGLVDGEILVFTYRKEVVYIANAASGIYETPAHEVNSKDHAHYFLVDMETLVRAHGTTEDLERQIKNVGLYERNIARSQGWNEILENDEVGLAKVEKILSNFGWTASVS